MKRSPSIIALIVLINMLSCKKDGVVQCEALKEAAFSDKIERVNTIINGYIQQLPSKTYNQQNIELLAQKISTCDISSSLRCFNCIQTLPSQTEISLDFSYNGTQIRKVIDLTYSADNKIIFRNMHD